MSNFKIETQSDLTKAAVIGNPLGFGQLLAKSLVEKKLQVDFFKTKDADSLFINSLISEFEFKTDSQQIYQNHYLFFLGHLNKNSLHQYETLVKQIRGKSFRHTLIILDIPDTPAKKSILESFNQAQVEFDQVTRSNSRIILLPYLYGPELKPNTYNSLNQAISQIHQPTVSVSGSETQKIYPLHTDDALDGILKATFKASTHGKILYLGGTGISLLNLLYKIKNFRSYNQSTFSITPDQTEADDKLGNLIEKSQDSIAFKPKTNLDSGLKETFANIPNTPRVLPEIPFITPPVEIFSPQVVDKVEDINPPVYETVITEYETEKSSDLENIKTPKSFELPSKRFGDFFNKKTFSHDSKFKTINEPKPRRKRKLSFYLTSGILLLILIYLFWLGLTVFNLQKSLSNAVTAIESRQIEKIKPNLESAYTNATNLKTHYEIFQPVSKIILGKKKTASFVNSIEMTQVLSKSGLLVIDASDDISQLAQILTGNTKGSLASEANEVSKEMVSVYHQLSLANTNLDAIDPNDLPNVGELRDKIVLLKEQLPQFRNQVAKANELLLVLPKIAGENERKTYLVLFQNNMELRPTGGFIGSFGLLSFENGVIRDLQVEDVYAADGQLQGYVEPPEPISRYLGEASWFLRDSNWDFDFPTTGQTAAWFLEKEIGVNVDGVIGINLEFAQAVLGVVGEVKLPDFDDTITANNLYEKAQYQSEINFFPGSTQKKDYLGQIARILYTDLFKADQETLLKFFQAVINQADQNNLQFAFADKNIQTPISAIGWSGEVVKTSCPVGIADNNCISDYLAVVDANLGVNKANLFLKRSVVDTVSISDKEISHTLQINYKNNSTTNVWPGGIYRNYLRIYTPEGSQLTEIKINGLTVLKDQIQITTEHGKTVFGTLVKVDPKATVNVTVDYKLPVTITASDKLVYQHYIQKQSGTTNDPYAFIYKSTSSLKPEKNNFEAKQSDLLQTQTLLKTDLIHSIEFMR